MNMVPNKYESELRSRSGQIRSPNENVSWLSWCHATYVWWATWDIAFDDATHVFHRRRGQGQVKLGQTIKHFFLNKNVSTFTCFVSGSHKSHFYARQFEIPKFAIQTGDVITFRYLFLYHCIAKNKDIALKVCKSVVCLKHYKMYSGFLHGFKTLNFIRTSVRKIDILRYVG